MIDSDEPSQHYYIPKTPSFQQWSAAFLVQIKNASKNDPNAFPRLDFSCAVSSSYTCFLSLTKTPKISGLVSIMMRSISLQRMDELECKVCQIWICKYIRSSHFKKNQQIVLAETYFEQFFTRISKMSISL